jgi:putative phosphonate metabolism protein
MTERFAIYFAPAATSNLWERAATWLGRDAADGDIFDGPVAGIDRDRLLNLTQSANRYGFHATLKAPMALAEDTNEAELRAALTAFAARHRPVELGRLKLASLQGFLALMVDGENEALQDFAAHVVEDFDPFRAPMTVKDRAARASKGLSERQLELLDAYGYPYVFEEFRFHMTLTGRLPAERRKPIVAMLRDRFSATDVGPLAIDAIALCRQETPSSRFRVIGRWRLQE